MEGVQRGEGVYWVGKAAHVVNLLQALAVPVLNFGQAYPNSGISCLYTWKHTNCSVLTCGAG